MQQKAALEVGRGNQVDKHSRVVFLVNIWQRNRGKKPLRRQKVHVICMGKKTTMYLGYHKRASATCTKQM